MKTPVRSHTDLIVWQKSMVLVGEIYSMTENFPSSELYGLSAQMRRCAVSIPSNIAEGRRRGTKKDFCSFLRIAFGSCAELETQIEITKRLGYCTLIDAKSKEDLLEEIMKMLHAIIAKLNM